MQEIYAWEELEYKPKQRKPDFYWALAIVGVALSLAAFVLSSVIIGMLILVSILCIAILSLRQPRMFSYAIGDTGIRINDSVFTYRDMASYYLDRKYFGHLVIKTSSPSSSTIIIHLPADVDFDDLQSFFDQVMPDKEKEMVEIPFHVFFERLGI